jgi:hypothetical protein
MFDPYGDGWERQQFSSAVLASRGLLGDIYCRGWRESTPAPPDTLLGLVPMVGKDQKASDTLRAEIDGCEPTTQRSRLFAALALTAPLRAVSSCLRWGDFASLMWMV